METTTHYFFWSIRSCLALLMVPCGFSVDLPGMGMTAESPSIRRWLFESLKFWLIFGEILRLVYGIFIYLIMYWMAALRRSELMLRTLSMEQRVLTGLPLR